MDNLDIRLEIAFNPKGDLAKAYALGLKDKSLEFGKTLKDCEFHNGDLILKRNKPTISGEK